MIVNSIIVVAGFIALLLLIALVMKKDFVIVSEVDIECASDKIFEYTKLMRNQEQYNKWIMADPNLNLQYTGTDGTVGFKATWISELKNVGAGEQEIIKILPGEGYDVELRFKKPMEGVSYARYRITKLSDTRSKYITRFETRTPFPMNIMVPLFMKVLKKDMDETSTNLKRILESK